MNMLGNSTTGARAPQTADCAAYTSARLRTSKDAGLREVDLPKGGRPVLEQARNVALHGHVVLPAGAAATRICVLVQLPRPPCTPGT